MTINTDEAQSRLVNMFLIYVDGRAHLLVENKEE